MGEYGVALVAGVVGDGTTMMAAAAPKHFSCYSGPENWNGIMRWAFDAVVPDKFLTYYFHPGWEVRTPPPITNMGESRNTDDVSFELGGTVTSASP